MLGLISRTITYRNPNILLNLYKSLVRPHLDYCSSVWNPYYSKDINLLERVQHRFTRLFSELRSLPYEERLRQLGLWSLEERRSRSDLIELFKLAKGISGTAFNEFFHVPVPLTLRYFLVPQYHKYRGSSGRYLSVVNTQ